MAARLTADIRATSVPISIIPSKFQMPYPPRSPLPSSAPAVSKPTEPYLLLLEVSQGQWSKKCSETAPQT